MGLSAKPPRHNVLTGLVPASLGSRLSQGQRYLPSGDATPMMPQPTFAKNDTDPQNHDAVCGAAGGLQARHHGGVDVPWTRPYTQDSHACRRSQL